MRDYVARRVSAEDAPYLLAPLVVACSTTSNTSGTYYAFLKGMSNWGAKSKHPPRKHVAQPVRLTQPVFNPHVDCVAEARCEDVCALAKSLPDDLDVAYLDPPYNEVSFGGHFHLYNTLARGVMPAAVTKVSGVDVAWQRSPFYCKASARASLEELLRVLTAKCTYVLLSYSDEGHLDASDVDALLEPYDVEKREKQHARFSNTGDKGAKKRRVVTEQLFIVSKKKV
jgi:adenine-specific DNA-methyltransferase